MAVLNIKKFPDPLYKRLQEHAVSDRRSLAQEVICLLEIAVEEKEKSSILELQGLGKKNWADIHATQHIDAERELWE